jgi:hypothetical protein
VIDFRGSTMARSLIMETEFHYHDMEGKLIPHKYKFDVLITTYEMVKKKKKIQSNAIVFFFFTNSKKKPPFLGICWCINIKGYSLALWCV